ncbi:MAG: hypothetical protein GY816_13245 [Cytophagales bacterium]|nr:hypothetical protein [Cytophagales bacterium]
MKSISSTLLLIFFILFVGCSTNNTVERYRLDKRFWTPKDYEKILADIKYDYEGTTKPSYSNQELVMVYKKLVDHENFLIVINDDELGVNHRSDFASEMFKVSNRMSNIYYDVNREDKLVYPLEMIEISHFGLDLQSHYFRLGNEAIIQNADDPEANQIKKLLKSNIQVLISNYSAYLDFVKQEDSFSEDELSEYVKGFELYFEPLVEKYPEANFNKIVTKLDAMSKKAQSETLLKALQKLRVQLTPEIEETLE